MKFVRASFCLAIDSTKADREWNVFKSMVASSEAVQQPLPLDLHDLSRLM
jgi:hypothetical protein